MYPIYFLRHGEPHSKYGLTPIGISQTEKLTQTLNLELKDSPPVIITTSPLPRSELTGRIIQLNLEHQIKSFQIDKNQHIEHFVQESKPRKKHFKKLLENLIKKSTLNPVISVSHEEIIYEISHYLEPEIYFNRYQNVSGYARGYKFSPDKKTLKKFNLKV
jgi:phosphohistidine phosphatase SixA